nr:hypothetical protein [Tanacetum cinerariifolium]
MGDENPIRTLRDYFKPTHEGYKNTIELLEGKNVEPLDPTPFGRTAKLYNNILMFQQHEGWSIVKHGLDLRTYSSKSLIMTSTFGSNSKSFMTMSILPQDEPLTYQPVNYPKDFAKPVKAISLPQDVPITSDRCLIKLKNQVQSLMEAHLAPKQPIQVRKINSSCKIYSGFHDTQYCMENPKQAFVNYASSRIDEVRGKQFTMNQRPISFNEATNA